MDARVVNREKTLKKYQILSMSKMAELAEQVRSSGSPATFPSWLETEGDRGAKKNMTKTPKLFNASLI